MLTEAEIAAEAARRGAEVLLRYWRKLDKDDADLKARNDWVSRADRESEQAIQAFLREQRPGDGFLGEESGVTEGADANADRVWIVDPLDGTSNYLRQFPVWSVSIALRENGEMVAGAIHQPLLDEMFTAERGAGAFRNGERLQISDEPHLEGAFVTTGFPFRALEHVEVYCAIFKDVISTAKGVRRPGSAALDLAYTAAGIFDGFFELHLSLWDIAAGALLVKEAGGVVTDFSGGDRYFERGNIVGAAPGVHRDLLELIGRHVSETQL